MGLGSGWHWLLILLVFVLLFGAGKISELMGDLAKGIKSFKKEMAEGGEEPAEPAKPEPTKVIEHTVEKPAQDDDQDRVEGPAQPEIGLAAAHTPRGLGFAARNPRPEAAHMFDIGWSELLVIIVVAIVVVGPKDLPRLMGTFGHYAGKLRRAAADFQRQFDEAMRDTRGRPR